MRGVGGGVGQEEEEGGLSEEVRWMEAGWCRLAERGRDLGAR